MSSNLQIDQIFSDQNLVSEGFEVGEYEACIFERCIFIGLDLGSTSFEECEFIDCDLSNVKVSNTAFRDVRFNKCKMLGIHFEAANPFLFTLQFTACQLSVSSFYQCVLKQTHFKDCLLKDVDFVEADLTKARFINCDLDGALFDQSILVKSDFSSAINYTINPEKNRLKGAVFSRTGLEGLLGNYGIVVKT